MSPSIANRSKHLLNDPRFEPSRSRMLNAMKANTKGMLAIHASRRRFRADPNRIGFIGVGPTLCCVASSGSDSYSTDAVTLSTGPNARPTRLKSTRMHSILSLINHTHQRCGQFQSFQSFNRCAPFKTLSKTYGSIGSNSSSAARVPDRPVCGRSPWGSVRSRRSRAPVVQSFHRYAHIRPQAVQNVQSLRPVQSFKVGASFKDSRSKLFNVCT